MPGDEVARPRIIEGIEMLLYQEIRNAGCELQANGSRHRTPALMRRDIAAMGKR